MLTPEEVNRIAIAMVDRPATKQDIEDFSGGKVIPVIDAYDRTPERKKIRGKVDDYDHLYKTALDLEEQLRVAKANTAVDTEARIAIDKALKILQDAKK